MYCGSIQAMSKFFPASSPDTTTSKDCTASFDSLCILAGLPRHRASILSERAICFSMNVMRGSIAAFTDCMDGAWVRTGWRRVFGVGLGVVGLFVGSGFWVVAGRINLAQIERHFS